MIRQRLIVTVVAAATAALLTGCELADDFRDHYTNTTAQELTRILNDNMRTIVGEWTTVVVGPTTSGVRHTSCAGLDPTLTKRPGPPWVVGLRFATDDPTDEELQRWNAGVDSIEESGYVGSEGVSTQTIPNPAEPQTVTRTQRRLLTNSQGYQVSLRIRSDAESRFAEVEAMSPCVSYPGDEKATGY